MTAPALTLSTRAVFNGGPITVSGVGFGRRLSVLLTVDGVAIGYTKTNYSGKFSTSITASGTVGTHTIKAHSASARLTHDASTTFEIRSIVVPPVITPPKLLLDHVFSRDGMGPWKPQTYPNAHPGDLMVKYGDFVTDAAHINLTEGPFLTLRADRPSVGARWRHAMVTTGLEGSPYKSTFSYQYGVVTTVAAMNVGVGAWASSWQLANVTTWSDPAEIDMFELIGQRITANLHGSKSNGQKLSVAPFPSTEFHAYTTIKTPTYIAFAIDEKEIARVPVAMPSVMALLLDNKVGLTAPDASTPNLFLKIERVTVSAL